MKLMVVDAQEPTEPQTFVIDTDKAKPPKHMMRMIDRSVDKCFEHIYPDDGAESMAGLVNEEDDSAEEHAEEVFEYLNAQCIKQNKYKPGMVADAYISIAAS